MRRLFCVLTTMFLCAVVNAQTDAVPRVVGLGFAQNDKGDVGFWIAGAYSGKRAMDAKSAAALATRGRRYHVYTMRGERATVTGEKAKYTEDGEKGWTVATAQSLDKEDFPCLILSDTGAKQKTRIPKRQVAENPVYVKAAADWIRRETKISAPKPYLSRHYRIDLNGDGEEEVLLSGSSRPNYNVGDARIGDYGFAVLRFYDGKQVKMVSLGLEYANAARAKQFPFSAPAQYQILACADINGDGRQEIAVVSTAHESETLDIFAFDGKTVRKILTESWGL